MNFSEDFFSELNPQDELIHLDFSRKNYSIGFLKDNNHLKSGNTGKMRKTIRK